MKWKHGNQQTSARVDQPHHAPEPSFELPTPPSFNSVPETTIRIPAPQRDTLGGYVDLIDTIELLFDVSTNEKQRGVIIAVAKQCGDNA